MVLQVSNDKNPGCLGCIGDSTTQTIIRIPSKHPVKWKVRGVFRYSTGMALQVVSFGISFFKLPCLKLLPTSKSLLSRCFPCSSTVRDVYIVFWRKYHLRNVFFLGGTLSKKKPFVVNISDLSLEPFRSIRNIPPQKKPKNSLKVSWREDWRDRKRTWRQGWEKPTQLSPTKGQRQAKWTKGIAKGKSRVT